MPLRPPPYRLALFPLQSTAVDCTCTLLLNSCASHAQACMHMHTGYALPCWQSSSCTAPLLHACPFMCITCTVRACTCTCSYVIGSGGGRECAPLPCPDPTHLASCHICHVIGLPTHMPGIAMNTGMHASALAYTHVWSEPCSGHYTARLASSASPAPPRLASLAIPAMW